MADSIAAFVDDLRADGHEVVPYVGYFTGPVVATLGVAATPSYRASNLSISVTSGSISDVRHGYLIRVETSGGVFKGWWNVRFAGTISTGNLPIRELNKADINVVAGDVLKIHAYVPLVDKLPEASAATLFAPDQLPYVDQGEHIPPVACSGGHYFGIIPAGETVAQFTVSGAGSYTADSGSDDTGTHLYTVLAGTVDFATDSSSSDESPTFEGGAGESTILHTFTDSTNSKTWSQYIYVRIYSEDDPPLECTVEGDLAVTDESEGWSATVAFYETLPLATLPDGALACLFVREWINGVEQSFSSTGAQHPHMVLVGYFASETIDATPEGRVSIRIVSPLNRLLNLPGFSKVLEDAATALNWQQIENMTFLLAILHIIRWFTSATENFDVTFSDDSMHERYSKLVVDKMVPAEQIRDLAKSRAGRLVCFQDGRIDIHKRPPIMTLAERTAASINHLGAADVIVERANAPKIERLHFKKLESLKFSGIVSGATNTTTVYAIYPGKGRGRGGQNIVFDRGVIKNLSEALTRCALMGAEIDGVFNDDANQVYERAYLWSLPLPGAYNVFDLDQSFIAFDDAPGNLRDVDVTRLRHWIKGIRIRFERRTALIQLDLAAETFSAQAEEDDPPPQVSLPAYTPPDFIPIPFAPPVEIPRLGKWSEDLMPTKMIGCDANGAKAARAFSWNPTSGSISWEDISTELSGSCIWMSADPFDYRRYFIATDEGLYRCDNVWATSPTWSLVADNATIFGDESRVANDLLMNINRRGFIALPSGQVWVYSFDYGATWNESAPYSSGYATAQSIWRTHFAVSPFNSASSGRVYASAYAGSGANRLYRSDDWGETWTLVASNTSTGWNPACVSVPYQKPGGGDNVNDGEQVVFVAGGGGHSQNFGALRKSVNAGSTFTSIFSQSSSGAHVPAPVGSGTSLVPFTWDSDIVICATLATGAGGDNGGFRLFDGTTTVYNSNGGYTGGNNEVGVNGFALHSTAVLYWFMSGGGGIRWWFGSGSPVTGTMPSFFVNDGGRCFANVQWDLSDFVAPAP